MRIDFPDYFIQRNKMDVVGFGALNLDRLYVVEHLAGSGEHQEILEFEELPGGSAANTIAGLSKLGLKTGFIGAVGDDSEARILLEDFNRYGVDTEGIGLISGRTGFIIGVVDAKGERTLYPYPGVNNELVFRKEHLEYVKNARYLHLSSFVGEKQFKAQKKLVASLPETVEVSFSPGILYSRRGLSALQPIIERSSIIFLNEVETTEITGEDYVEGSAMLIKQGAGIVAVTLGSRGCYILDSDGGRRINAEEIGVLDTTGAGDAFAAGFLYGLVSGKNILESGRLGNKAAAFCIKKLGARTGLPTRAELE